MSVLGKIKDLCSRLRPEEKPISCPECNSSNYSMHNKQSIDYTPLANAAPGLKYAPKLGSTIKSIEYFCNNCSATWQG